MFAELLLANIGRWGSNLWATWRRLTTLLRPENLSLTIRLLIPLIAVGGLTFGALQVAESALIREQQERLLHRHEQTILDGVTARLSDMEHSWGAFAELVAAQPGIAPALQSADTQTLASLLVPFLEWLTWGGVRVFDQSDAEVIGLGLVDPDAEDGPPPIGSVSGRAQTAVAVTGRGFQVTATAPIRDATGFVGRAVVTAISPAAGLLVDNAAEAGDLAVYRNGVLVQTTARTAGLLDLIRSKNQAELESADGILQLQAIGYRVAVRPLDARSAIAILVPTAGLTTSIEQTGQIRLLITLVAGAAMVLVLVGLAWQFGHSIAAIVATTVEVAKGNYTQRVAPSRLRELAHLGEAVNDMAEQLQGRLGELEHRAFHDVLTGLPNRALFVNRIDHAVQRAQRSGLTIAVLFIDLDDFKVVNDTLGHDAGDTLLKNVAGALQSCTRGGDTVARLGGDEFALLLDPVEGEAFVKGMAQRVLQALADPMRLNGQQVYVRCSIGLALSPNGAVPADKVVQHADMAMYKAKGDGKGRFAVYEAEMSEVAWERLRVEDDLQIALRDRQFRLFYQPLVDLCTGRVMGAEALLRWQHPTRGLLPPKAFVEVGEQTGLIVQMEDWACQEASRQLKGWQQRLPDADPLRMHLNVSAHQFRDPDVVERLVRHTDAAGVDRRHLTLELTERTAVTVTDTKPHLLPALRDAGFNLAIDDFGVSGSSFAYFKEFPINGVKLDIGFVAGLGLNPTDTAIVEAVLGFARSLNLNVSAEGIETEEQLVHLRDLGCAFGQGYIFGAPMPLEAFEALLFGEMTVAATSERQVAA